MTENKALPGEGGICPAEAVIVRNLFHVFQRDLEIDGVPTQVLLRTLAHKLGLK